MSRFVTLTLAMLAGGALGAIAVNGLNAQTRPPAYVVIDITQMTDPEGFKAIPASPAASAARLAALGGRYVIRTEEVTALDGAPPKRFVVLAFDSKEKARGWYDAPDIKEINALREKTTKSSTFIVEGVANQLVEPYMLPKPGDPKPVAKVRFVQRVADLGCGVGYYK